VLVVDDPKTSIIFKYVLIGRGCVEEAFNNHAYTCLYKTLDMAEVLQLVGETRERRQRAG